MRSPAAPPPAGPRRPQPRRADGAGGRERGRWHVAPRCWPPAPACPTPRNARRARRKRACPPMRRRTAIAAAVPSRRIRAMPTVISWPGTSRSKGRQRRALTAGNRDAPVGRWPRHLPGHAALDRAGATLCAHGDVYLRRRRARRALRRSPDRGAQPRRRRGADGGCRGHHQDAGRLVPAPARRGRAGRGVQSGEPRQRQPGRLVSEPAQSSQDPGGRWQGGLSRRDQRQRRVRIFAGQREWRLRGRGQWRRCPARRRPCRALARYAPAYRGAGRGAIEP